MIRRAALARRHGAAFHPLRQNPLHPGRKNDMLMWRTKRDPRGCASDCPRCRGFVFIRGFREDARAVLRESGLVPPAQKGRESKVYAEPIFENRIAARQ
jgi:hypothetical protein